MDLMRLGNVGVSLETGVLDLVRRLSTLVGDPHAALKTLRRYLAGSSDQAEAALIDTILADVGLTSSTLRKRLERFGDLLELLQSSLGDLGTQTTIDLPFEQHGEVNLGTGELAIGGRLKAFAEADSDGDALEGRIRFDPSDEVVLRIGVEGQLEGNVGAKGNLGAVAGSIGVQAGCGLLLENFFRHQRRERVLDALFADLTGFDLPLRLRDGGDLRFRVGPGGVRIPDQWVHLNFVGRIALDGGLSFSQNVLSTARVTQKALAVDEILNVDTGFEGSVQFSHMLEGAFDLLVCPSASNSSRVRVELHKSVASERRLGVEVGATVGITGLDRIGRSILARVLPKLDKLVLDLDAAVTKGVPRLKELLEAKVDGQLEALLKKAPLTSELQRILDALKLDVNLRDRAEQLLKEAGLKGVSRALGNIDGRADELKEMLRELIRRYRRALQRLEENLAKAADVKVGITVGHARQRSKGREAFLVFDIDPAAEPAVFRRMLLGDFTEATRLAALNTSAVKLEDGLLVERGQCRISSSLAVTAFGFAFNNASLLAQDWEMQISPSGDVTIGVHGEVSNTRNLNLFGSASRTMTFFADSRVIASIAAGGSGGTLSGTTAGLELTEEFKVAGHKLSKLEQRLIAMGVIPPTTSISTELVSLSGDEQLNGTLSATALLALDATAIASLAAIDPSSARLTFALALNEFQSDDLLERLDSGDGVTPLLLWPSVEQKMRAAHKEESELRLQGWAPVDSRGRRIIGWGPRRTRLLYQQWLWMNAFRDTLGTLGEMKGALKGTTADDMLVGLRGLQQRLLQAAAPLVKGLTASSLVNFVFFRAVFDLVSGQQGIDPHAVVEYQGSRFVFG